MSDSRNQIQTQICCLSSLTPAAIATVWVSGPSAMQYVANFWRGKKPVNQLAIDAIHFGDWYYKSLGNFTDRESSDDDASHRTEKRDGLPRDDAVRDIASPGDQNKMGDNDTASESVVVCRTGDQTFEIHSHGGKMAAAKIMSGLAAIGANELSPEEYFLAIGDGKIAAESQSALLRVATTKAATVLLWQASGMLQRELRTVSGLIRDGDIPIALDRLGALQKSGRWGRTLIDPPRVTLCGLPNAGKSSLLNAIVGFERAIVHQAPGTTRDILVEPISANGWPMEICDTAGLRQTNEQIESIGIATTLELVKTSDLVVLLIASDQNWSDFHERVISTGTNRVLIVRSKSDLPNPIARLPKDLHWSLETSIQPGASENNREYVSKLLELLSDRLFPSTLPANLPVPFLQSHLDAIDSAISSLQSERSDPAQFDIATSTLESLL